MSDIVHNAVTNEKINGRIVEIREFTARKSSILIFVLSALNWKFV